MALTRVSMLTLEELQVLSGQRSEALRRVLGPKRVRAERLLGDRFVFDWSKVERALAKSVVKRIIDAARKRNILLVRRKETVAGEPRLLSEWSWKRNGALVPWRVSRMSTLSPWWKCAKGSDHEWREPVHRRNTKKRGKWKACPFCASRRISITNCLATRAPAVARQWHPTKNGQLTPRDVFAGSPRKVWWNCPKGRDHVWLERVSARTGPKPLGCPICSAYRVSRSNCLATVAPRLAKQWDAAQNRGVTPNDVVAGSTRLVWWRCSKGPDHLWRQSPKARMRGHGCPFCAGKKVSVTNCLARTFPALARQWHKKNGRLTPHDVVAGSGKRIWWVCPKDSRHVWRTSPNNRTSGGSGRVRPCPHCSGRRVAASNSLATVAPRIAKEWHPTLNGRLTPHDVTSGSRRRVYWRCRRGHVWRAMIRNRGRNLQGCPKCDLLRRRGRIT